MSLPGLLSIRRLALVGLAALCGCQPAAPIKVGFVGGLSGRVSELTVDARNGTQLAIETLNARPGPRYELRSHDDGHTAELGAVAIDSMADEGDAFAIGPMMSGVAKGMAPQASKRHLVLISPTANSDELNGLDDYFFRVIPTAGPGADQLAEAAIARGLKSAAVMAEWRNSAYSDSFTRRFDARFQALGGAPAKVVRYETDQSPDYAHIATELLASHPKVLLLVCSAVDASIVSQQLRRLDPGVQIAMSSWSANVQLLQLGGRAVEGALVLQVLDLDSRAPAWLDFRDRFVQRYGSTPSQAAVFAYDATMMGAEGLRRKTDNQSLRDVLRAPGTWPGVQQAVVLDHFGDSVSRFRLSEVHAGRFVMLH